MISKKEIKLIGIVINQINLVDLLTKINQVYSEYKISITMKDGSSFQEMTIKEIKKQDFSKKTIENIEIRFYDKIDYYYNQFNMIKVGKDDYKIEYSHNKDDLYDRVKGIIEHWMDENKPRKTVKFVHSVWSVFISSVAFNMPIIFMIGKNFILPLLIYFTILILFGSIFICYGLWYFAKFLYPLVEIDIGINRHKRFRQCFGWILSVIIIPTILAIILEIIL